MLQTKILKTTQHTLPSPGNSQLFFLGTLLLIWFVFTNLFSIGHFPNGMHMWTQTDHYALAKGFVDNGLDFFHPRMYAIAYEYPLFEETGKHTFITSVDFPIHNYIPAIFMKLSGSDSPRIYQAYLLLVSLTGLIYLFKAAYLLNRSFWLSLMIVAFVAFSPVFTFYQLRFIPSVPSISTAFIGLYYVLAYRQSGRTRHFWLGTLLLALTAMTRLTFAIVFFSWLGQCFFDLWKKEHERKQRIIALLSATGLFFGYFAYNTYLRQTYGGMFLLELMPARSWSEFVEITQYVWATWKTDYLTKAHYVFFGLFVLFWSYLYFIRKVRSQVHLPMWFFAFTLVGSGLFYLVMARQFPAHDYYFIDAFLFPLTLVVCFITAHLRKESGWMRYSSIFAILLFLGWSAYSDQNTQHKRHESERWGENARIVMNFSGSEKLLENAKIPKDASLLILERLPCNVPFLLMHRKGYMVMKSNKKNLEHALNLPPKYVVFQNEYFLSGIYGVWPGIIDHLEFVSTNGKITICRKAKKRSKSLEEFLHLEPEHAVLSKRLNDPNAGEWEIKGTFNADESCYAISESDEFGPVFKLRNSSLFEKYRLVYFTGQIQWDGKESIECVLSLTEKGELSAYKTYPVSTPKNGDKEWHSFSFLLNVPAAKSKETGLSVYLWNPRKTRYKVRNVNCSIY